MNKNKFGFYQVADKVFYSRIEAIEYGKIINAKVHWNFNEEIFKHFDWTKEPTTNIEQLYINRAKQIREQYDYVVIFYSGGADSHTVLNSFLRAGLRVDEIAQFHNYGGSGTWDSYLNEEVYKVSIPETTKIVDQYPHIKHRLIDLTDIIKDLYYKDNNKCDFIYKSNRVFSPNSLSRTYFRELIEDYVNIISSGKKLCFVWGSEKPSIDVENGKYYIYFADGIDNSVGPRTQQLNRSWEHDELFYWTPDAPEIVCKQGHIIKKFLQSINQKNIDNYLQNNYITQGQMRNRGRRRGSIEVNGKNYFLNTEFMNTLIYPWWDPTTFSNGKNPSGVFSHRDLWWFQDKYTDDRKKFLQGILKIKSVVGQEHIALTGDNPMYLNLKPMLSPCYYLE